MSGIRKILRDAGAGAVVRYLGSGYVLEVDPELVDARRFERLLDEGQRLLDTDPARARELFDHALACWSIPALAEFSDVELVGREADRLEELRVLAAEGLVEARLSSRAGRATIW